jgi:hypothetical protein
MQTNLIVASGGGDGKHGISEGRKEASSQGHIDDILMNRRGSKKAKKKTIKKQCLLDGMSKVGTARQTTRRRIAEYLATLRIP